MRFALVSLVLSSSTTVLAQADTLDAPPPPPPAASAPEETGADVDGANLTLTIPDAYTGYGAMPTLADPTLAARRVPGHPVDDSDAPSRAPRIAVGMLAGGAASFGSGLGMYGAGCVLAGGSGGSCDILGSLLGTIASVSMTPLAVFLTGQAMDGTGRYGVTLLGSAIGAVGGSIAGLFLMSGRENIVWASPLMVGTALGSVIAYELSSDASRSYNEQTEAEALRVSATVAPTDGGATLSVFGSY